MEKQESDSESSLLEESAEAEATFWFSLPLPLFFTLLSSPPKQFDLCVHFFA